MFKFSQQIEETNVELDKNKDEIMMKKVLAGIAAVLCIMLVSSAPSYAAIMSFSDETTWQSAVGSWNVADFEGFLGSVNTQYSGVTFTGNNGGAPYAVNVFPHEGQNSMFSSQPWNAGGGGWGAVFDAPVQAFAFWSGDVQFSGSTISIYDSANVLLGAYDLMGSGGGHGPYLYGFNGFISDSLNIARVAVSINGADSIGFDNFQYSLASQTPVPEPASMLLLGLGLAGLVGARRQLKK